MKGEKLAFATWIVCILAIGAILGYVFGENPASAAEATPGQVFVDDHYAPGAVLFSETFSEQSITISRPYLSPELEELVDEEGLYCCLAYTSRIGESATTATLILSKDPISLSIWENVPGYTNVSTIGGDLYYSMLSSGGNADSVSRKLLYADDGRECIDDKLSSTVFIFKEGALAEEETRDFESRLSAGHSYTFSPEMAKYSATEYLASEIEVETLKMLMMTEPLE